MTINSGILAGHLSAQLACTCVLYASSGFQLTAISKAVAAIAYMDAGCLVLLLGMVAARTVVYRSTWREPGHDTDERRRQLLKLYLTLYAIMTLVIPGINIWSTTVMIRARWAVWALFGLQILFILHLTLAQDGLGVQIPRLPHWSTAIPTHPALSVSAPASIGTKRNDPNVEDSIELLSDVAGPGGGGAHQGEGSSAMVLRSEVTDKVGASGG